MEPMTLDPHYDDDCIFCKILKGDIPSYTVYEDNIVKAFLDISQGTPGHTLVIPKTHVQDIFAYDTDLAAAVFARIPKIARAVKAGIWGTKERSVIKEANPAGIKAIAAQQFEWGKQVLSHGLVPILEPEVDIKAPNKAECEKLLKAELLAGLDALPAGQKVIFKLTIPDVDGFYSDLIKHPKTARVVALSGGYSRDEACAKLAKNPGMIASFSRALTEGLSAQQSDGDFNTQLKSAVDKIYQASIT